jgi:hypothetical protein
MMCDRCGEPMPDKEAKAYTIPGATGPGVTIRVHKRLCLVPPTKPRPYPYTRP